jgi:DNA-binding MarR family transcriptional regulator
MQHQAPEDSVDALLASWRDRRPDLDFAPVGIVARLARIRRRLAAALDEVYAAHGLTAPTFGVLVTLARVDDGEGVTQRRLMDELGLTSGTISVRMDRLVEEGLVEREPDPASRRATRIRLTAAGRALFERVVPEHLGTERRMLSGLSPAQQEELAGLLRLLLVELEGFDSPDDWGALGLVLAPAHQAIALRESVGLPPVTGLLVEAVEDGGAGEAAGLRTGDVLLVAGGHDLRAVSSLYEAFSDAGDRAVELRVVRGAEERTVSLQPAVERSVARRPRPGRHVL